MKLPPLYVIVLVGAGLGAVAMGYVAGRRAPGRKAPAAAVLPYRLEDALVLRVPHAKGNIALDGDLDDPGWQNGARTHAFVGPDGVTAARPHSEARVTWAGDYLYLGLYAADEDIRAKATEHDVPIAGDDFFHVVFSDGQMDRVIDVSPTGVVTDGTRRAGTQGPLALGWESEAHVSVERDGTPNDPSDNDEEWIVEMAIPFESLGLRGEKGEAIGLSLRRCDTLRGGATLCGSWGEGGTNDEIDPGRRSKKGVILLE